MGQQEALEVRPEQDLVTNGKGRVSLSVLKCKWRCSLLASVPATTCNLFVWVWNSLLDVYIHGLCEYGHTGIYGLSVTLGISKIIIPFFCFFSFFFLYWMIFWCFILNDIQVFFCIRRCNIKSQAVHWDGCDDDHKNTHLNSDKENEAAQFCTGCTLLRVIWSLETPKLSFLTAEFPGSPRLPEVGSTEK